MSDQQAAVARDAAPLEGVHGTVKWFDPRKGFGFVVGPGGQDIFIHFSVIDQPNGFRTLKDGEEIVYSAHYGNKGWAATQVKSAGRTGALGAPSREPAGEPERLVVERGPAVDTLTASRGATAAGVGTGTSRTAR